MEKLAAKIKRNTNKFYAVAIVIFIVTLIIGFWWLIDPANNYLEPLTYVGSGICSIFWGIPKIAEFILPNIILRDMSHDQILNFILQTDGKIDWQSNQTTDLDERFLKQDIRLRIRRHDEEDLIVEDFTEDWANSFPNPQATSYSYNILYDNHFIEQVILVFVDGNRASLPLPDLETRQARKLDYKIAQIYNNQNILDNYMQRANILI